DHNKTHHLSVINNKRTLFAVVMAVDVRWYGGVDVMEAAKGWRLVLPWHGDKNDVERMVGAMAVVVDGRPKSCRKSRGDAGYNGERDERARFIKNEDEP
nr:hypothetical protein [Tanacetum cinerariifolium]